MEKVEVIQSDRERAADVWRDYIARIGEIIVERNMRKGGLDDGLPTIFARHRLAHTAQDVEPVELRPPSEIPAAIELWFFRDLGETQRRQLINWCGFPGVEANGEDFQRKALRSILAPLYAHPPAQAPTEQRQSEPSGDAVPVPQHADQAALMVLLGTDWLKRNAPERLRPEPSGDVAKMREALEKIAKGRFVGNAKFGHPYVQWSAEQAQEIAAEALK